jgi:single-strand DNA-binding protein
MPNGAEVNLVGNLTRDPELRFTKTDKPVCHFSVAVNRYTGKDNPDVTTYFDCVAWDKLGEHAAESLSKGQRVIVLGRLDQRQWEKEDGSKGSRWEVTADAVGPDLRFNSLGDAKPVRQTAGYGASEDPF